MAAETIEYPAETALQPVDPAEGRIVLEASNAPWQTRARCRDAYDEELAYGLGYPKDNAELLDEEQAAIRFFCGPCPVQELCLAQAVVENEESEIIIGGLTARARAELQKHYDPETKSLPTRVWQIAIDAVLDAEYPKFPEPLASAPSAGPAQTMVREFILNLLTERPDNKLEIDSNVNLYGYLTTIIPASRATISRSVAWLESNGSIAKVKGTKRGRITALKLVA